MRLTLIVLGLCALLYACPGLLAQRQDAKARDITSRSEYRGYRVEQPPGSSPREANPDDGGEGQSGAGGDERGYRRGADAAPRRGGSSGSSPGSGLSLPGWIGTLFEVLIWIVLIVGVCVALFFIIKALIGMNWKRKKKSKKSKREPKSEETEAGKETASEEEDAFDEKVFEDALAVALRDYKAALARDDFAAATLLGYRVFWLRAGWQGCVEVSDTRTWRDALRMVRQTDTRREVRELLPLVERVRYADHVPARHEFNDWSIKLDRINPQGVL